MPGAINATGNIAWEILGDQKLVIAMATGQVGVLDVQAYMDAIVVAGAQHYRKLFDASEMDFDATDDELMLLAARIRAYGSAFGGGPLALVATRGEAHDWFRRYLNLADIDRPARIFNSRHEALRWLDSLNGDAPAKG